MENYRVINVQQIDRPNPPVRISFNETEIQSLTESIREKGILVPLLVRPVGDRYEVVDGDRRFEAAYRLRLREIPCVVRDATDSETHVLRMLANLDREDPDVVSEAVYIAKAINAGVLTAEEFASKLKRSINWIDDRLSIAEMPDYMQEALRQKQLPLGVALALAQIDDDDTRYKWMMYACQNGMNVRGAEDALREYRKLAELQRHVDGSSTPVEIPTAPPVVLYKCAACGGNAPLQELRTVQVHSQGCPTG